MEPSIKSVSHCVFWFYKFVTEQGEFLALDLGGSNFRVLLVRVMADGEQKVEMEDQIYPMPEDLMRGSGTEVRKLSHIFFYLRESLHCVGTESLLIRCKNFGS